MTALSPLVRSTAAAPETLGLWGAVHKRLWGSTGDPEDLQESIQAYERGFHVKSDYYNGINLAFMLDVRAAASEGDESIADRVLASRVRKRVVGICEDLIADLENEEMEPDYWILATLEEAFHALGDSAQEARWRQRAEERAHEPWMRESTLAQLAKLDALRSRPSG